MSQYSWAEVTHAELERLKELVENGENVLKGNDHD